MRKPKETMMDYDVGNQQMLRAGALAQQGMNHAQGWQSMDTAPRDGTVIEIRCTYGVAPWYGLYRWTDNYAASDQDGNVHEYKGELHWSKVGDGSSSFREGPSFTWRPYHGDVSAYVDPTGGAQNSMAYWRGAVAAKYGLPIDTFEKNTPTVERTPKPRSFFRRLFRD